MTEVMQVREAYRVEQWRQLMQQRKDSPLNNREFCAQQGISEKSYYYWLKKLRESAMERGIPQLVALEDREKPDELRIGAVSRRGRKHTAPAIAYPAIPCLAFSESPLPPPA